jgi:tryptophan 2,3-dioxygenase
MVGMHRHDPGAERVLRETLETPEHLRRLPAASVGPRAAGPYRRVLDRDVTKPHESHPGVIEVFKTIYTHPEQHWDAYEMAEKLVDVEEQFGLWRYRHMRVVERIIGFKKGTGGSSGVAFLRQMIDHRFFPELVAVRTEI